VTRMTADQLDIRNGDVFLKTDAAMKVPVATVGQGAGLPILGRSLYRQDDDWERTAWASHAVEVEVDTGIGSVKILKYVAAHDVGKAINPFAVEQQIEGGVVMALGAVFNEQLLIDSSTGLPINANMLDYRPPSILDVPDTIDVVVVEKAKAYGVFGARGIGEPRMVSGVACRTAGVHLGTGV